MPCRSLASESPSSAVERVGARWWSGLLLFLAACGSGGGPDPAAERSLVELERLAFVPSGRLVISGLPGLRMAGPHADCSVPEPLVFDLFEMTRAEAARFDGDLPDAALSWEDAALLETEPERADEPAPLSLSNARAIAELRGMRLPTTREWLHVALGGRGRLSPFPWGRAKAYSGGNTLELGLGGPTIVGSFLGGRSRPFGCYDLVGNLAEWTEGVVPGYDDLPVRPETYLEGPWSKLFRSVMGGSYATRLEETYEFDLTTSGELRFYAKLVGVDHRSPDVGARMCAEAADYLVEHAARWPSARNARERVARVGARWAQEGREASLIALVDELAEAHPELVALAWLVEGARR